MSPNEAQYEAVEDGAAWIDRSSRVRLNVGGPDAAKFLHNLTTNDVKRLSIGRGCEAFITSPQGKTLAYVLLHALPGVILLRSDPEGLETALPHLQKYGIFDDVSLDDVSSGSTEIHIVGPQAQAWLEAQGTTIPADDLGSTKSSLGGREVLCIRESPTGRSGFTLIDHGQDSSIIDFFQSAGLPVLDAPTFDVLRIEAGTPQFGREVDLKNLPQEIARDDRTISFVKGCYLGQETVARLDALGHVNKILRGLRFRPEDPIPPPGAALEAGGKAVGAVASSAFSPGWGGGVGLAIVRVSHATAGVELHWKRPEDSATFTATVSDLPMVPSRS